MDADTAIGGPIGRFPDTLLTAIEQAANDDPEIRRVAHEAIAAAYWKPVYKYIRLKWRESNESAKDLTQSFFAKALAKDFFASYDPEQAAFRTFVRVCVDRFVANERQFAARQKRSAQAAEVLDETIPAAGADLDEYFHQEWIRQVFALAVAELREECRDIPFRAFEMYDLAEGRKPSYAEIAAELYVPVTQVTNYLAAARRDLRRIVLSRIRSLTATEREYKAEVRAVLGIDV
jgi:RNA polymerase sigma factor (sigma-70 family)